MQGAQVQSPVEELRSRMTRGMARVNNKWYFKDKIHSPLQYSLRLRGCLLFPEPGLARTHRRARGFAALPNLCISPMVPAGLATCMLLTRPPRTSFREALPAWAWGRAKRETSLKAPSVRTRGGRALPLSCAQLRSPVCALPLAPGPFRPEGAQRRGGEEKAPLRALRRLFEPASPHPIVHPRKASRAPGGSPPRRVSLLPTLPRLSPGQSHGNPQEMKHEYRKDVGMQCIVISVVLCCCCFLKSDSSFPLCHVLGSRNFTVKDAEELS